jgi:hypothetical protein
MDMFQPGPWYNFFHYFFALRFLVGIFGFLTFVLTLFMFQNLAMRGQKAIIMVMLVVRVVHHHFILNGLPMSTFIVGDTT